MTNNYWVYILASKRNGTLYIGMTHNLELRLLQHKNKMSDSFTAKYNVTKLVYLEQFNRAMDAIQTEKKLKGWTRAKKIKLIESKNPDWTNLDPSFHSG